eukprot:CAMPEP_0194701754 /NCGR_PEP_ID=MMETSP0295-20121207/26419_1 /TAXON_ID=39354 /ORGANISM="Heterosigma akashiwo, Strain CCMP2393" /LENGTH=123 /DNA_ID=CAMNT_0039596095 /DNA_START=240 /DNA_END=609 /DNA_ORIENTATION=+
MQRTDNGGTLTSEGQDPVSKRQNEGGKSGSPNSAPPAAVAVGAARAAEVLLVHLPLGLLAGVGALARGPRLGGVVAVQPRLGALGAARRRVGRVAAAAAALRQLLVLAREQVAPLLGGGRRGR